MTGYLKHLNINMLSVYKSFPLIGYLKAKYKYVSLRGCLGLKLLLRLGFVRAPLRRDASSGPQETVGSRGTRGAASLKPIATHMKDKMSFKSKLAACSSAMLDF